MDKRHTGKRWMLALVVMLCLAAGLALAEEAKLTLDQEQAAVFKGKNVQLTAQVSGTEEKVKYIWESSDTAIPPYENETDAVCLGKKIEDLLS